MVNNKNRILRLLMYLYRYTDEAHPVSTGDIIDLMSDGQDGINRRTVRSDIDTLIQEGFDIVCRRSSGNLFYLRSRAFSESELKVLLDAVNTCASITEEDTRILRKKLLSFCTSYEEEALGFSEDTDFSKTANPEAMENIRILMEAVRDGKQVVYQYYDYDSYGQRILSGRGEMIRMSPWRLTRKDDYCCVIGRDDAGKLIQARTDRMTGLRFSGEKAEQRPEDLPASAQTRGVFDMGEQERTQVVLSCRKEAMQSVIAHFGGRVDIWHRDGSEDVFFTRLNVVPGAGFYSWIFSFGGKVRIQEPEAVAEDFRRMLDTVWGSARA